MSTPPQSSFEKDVEEDYSPNRDSQDSSTSTSSSFYFSQWPIISKASGCLASLDIPRWHLQYPRPFSRRFVAVVFFAILSSFIGYTAYHAGHNYSLSSSSFPELTSLYSSNNNHHLPHIPPNIWQIYLEYSVEKMAEYKENIMSFVASSPTSQYSIIDEQGALSLLTKLSQRKKYADILSLFYAMPRRVTRADFLRYVVLALEGGVYSDIDTQMFKPLNEWVPEEHKNRTKLVVGIEFDQDGPGWGSFYPVTFAQWTIAAAPNRKSSISRRSISSPSWFITNYSRDDLGVIAYEILCRHSKLGGVKHANTEILIHRPCAMEYS